ncbi:N-acetylmuramic acid 6-phosphate etherase [Luteococcus peritonei]|uniref:N-acetylmuramic acid 6-phosphate etherase n=1 Tax=Luteococcus peritonei TaxID=88874 RepID=A0ABW4RWN2_9ACTN
MGEGEGRDDRRDEVVGPLSWSTEQRNPRTMDLDQLDAGELVARILAEDARVAAAVQAVQERIGEAVELAVRSLAAGGRVHYVGSGTSGRLGVLDAVELFPTYRVGDEMVVAHLAGGMPAMMRAAEGAEDDEQAGRELAGGMTPKDLVVGLAASGRTPYVRGAMAAARELGCATALVSANPQAPLAELADVAILVDTGPEVVTGSTRMKAATAQKMVLNTFSTATMVRMGKTYSNLMIDVVATNAKLRRRMVTMLQQASGADEQAAERALAEADGQIRPALVALLSDASVDEAARVLAELPPDPSRREDPAGIRTAAERLRQR